MRLLKKMQDFLDCVYCSRVWQFICRGGVKDKAGKKLMRARSWRDAEQYYERLLSQYPGKVLFLERLATVKKKLEKNVEAQTIFTGLASKYPGVSRFARHLLEQRAAVKEMQGELDAAAAILEELMSKYPENQYATVKCAEIAKIFVKRGEENKAIEILERALDHAPHSELLLVALIEIYRGTAQWENEKKCHLRRINNAAKERKNSVFIAFCRRCIRVGDIDAMETAACPDYFKANFTQYFHRTEKMNKERLSGFSDHSAECFEAGDRVPPIQLFKCSMRHSDIEGKFVIFSDGVRRTVGVPEKYDKTVYLIGDSRVCGQNYDDSHTIASFLQSFYNASPENKTRVVNLGVGRQGEANAFLMIMMENIQKNDDIVFFPPVHSNPIKTDAFLKMCNYNSAMHEICSQKMAKFYIAFLPHLFGIDNPSTSEKILQLIEAYKYGKKPEEEIKIRLGNYKKCHEFLQRNSFQIISLQHIADRPNDLGEIFTIDWNHFNIRANRQIARELHARLSQPVAAVETYEILPDMKTDAVRYLESAIHRYSMVQGDVGAWLKEVKNPQFGGLERIGAVVMNCNPFTLGHQYLIESAAKMVDGLYVFVVQEDKSYFPFQDRLSLVRQGVRGIPTLVHVVPSGEFIISNLSFPGYFSETRAIKPADSTNDVMLFGSIIAPALGITNRFVGEEPNCATTNKYNETMKFLLPSLGVKVHVIQRKGIQGKPVSATTVRNCLEENDFETIAQLVPATTLEYLKAFKLAGNDVNSADQIKGAFDVR